MSVYKIGFPDGTPVGAAKEQAVRAVRETDQGAVIAGPDIVQSEAHRAAGEYLVRVVTGEPGDQDPKVRAERARAEAAAASRGDEVIGRLAALPPEKLAALGALLDKL